MELHALKAFYDPRSGLVELDDDVLSIVRQVREAYGSKVKVSHEPTTGHYIFSENCDDGTERLIFTCEELDGRALERLRAADARSRGYIDPYERAEVEQDKARQDQDEQKLEVIRDAGEQLAWALGDGKAGPGYHQSIHVKREISA